MIKFESLPEYGTFNFREEELMRICKSLRSRLLYAVLSAGGEVKFPKSLEKELLECEILTGSEVDGDTIVIRRPEGDLDG